ncbi:ArsR/SmtB family transcription factor [Alkalihalobacillus pseudalcaliphilus]|uniref:ArsR/SmtB family transcription factor n=1 Tax=Alkalihalobacillus pseudalcaliphilus TaxID=79884 RepID=UPI00064DF848|nr:metalloregulator ArsR/SmtB family transcription factor [Alkalihalobacillus pseudalcaliphilus]KMK76298.1 ArsR family transcriptional regulator [Alkalihalobacillus pseudalcaliphilus]
MLKIEDTCATTEVFKNYEVIFKALADQKRLHLLNILSVNGSSCVCDLINELDMPQSKLSYHLKILLNANLITKETKGTWSYYEVKEEQMNAVLSNDLCCVFKPSYN